MDRDSPFIAGERRSSPRKSSPSKYLASSPLKMHSPTKTPLRTLTANDANIRANTPQNIEYTVHSLKKKMEAVITSPQKMEIKPVQSFKPKKKPMPTMEEVLSRSKSMNAIPSSMGPPVAEFHIPELYTSLHRSSSDPPHPLTPEQAAAARMLTQRRRLETVAREAERNNLSSDATIPSDGALEDNAHEYIDSDGNELSPRLRRFVDAITSGSSSSEEDEAGHISKKLKRKGSPSAMPRNRMHSNSGASDDDGFPLKRSRSNTPMGDNPVKKRRQTKKPDHPTYRAMIGIVLSFAPLPFCLNDIYEKVLEYWPTLRGEDLKRGDSGWKNSIRHNLSLNPEYVHKPRPADLPGKGDIWQMLDEWTEGHKKAADEWLEKMQARGASYVKDADGLRITRHPDLEGEDEEENDARRKRLRLDDPMDAKRRASTGSAAERKPKRRNIKYSKSTSNLQKGKEVESAPAEAVASAAAGSSEARSDIIPWSTIIPTTNIFASTEDYNASTANVYLTSSPMRGYPYPPPQRKEHSLLSSSPMPEVKYFAQDSLIMTPPRVPTFFKGSPTPNTRKRQLERTVYGPTDYGVSPGKAEAIEQDRQLLAQMYEGADAFYSYNSSLDPSQFKLTSAGLGPGPSPLGKRSVSAHDLEEEATRDAANWKTFFQWERKRVAESGNSRTAKFEPW